MSLHQDKDEYDLPAPIVSVSQGLPAFFQFGGLQRNAPTQRGRLAHGDMLVWGDLRAWLFTAYCPWPMGITRCWTAGA